MLLQTVCRTNKESLHRRGVQSTFLLTELRPQPSAHALCPTGDMYEGEFKEDRRSGKGIMTLANGVCHVDPLGLRDGPDSVSKHTVLQETGMRASGRRTRLMEEAFLPGAMVCAT